MAVETMQSALLAAEWVTSPLATAAIGLRLASRLLTKAHFWLDDVFALAAYLIAVFWVFAFQIWMGKGLGLHITDIHWMSQADAGYYSRLLLFICETLYASALYFGKMGILCFYWRLFRVSSIKWPILVLMGISTLWILIRCHPVQAFWDLNAGGGCSIDDSKFFIGTILPHVLIDVAILALPIVQVRKLHLPRWQKVGIMALFMFGILVCASAMTIVGIAFTFDGSSPDITWNITQIVVWASVEVNLVTVSVCLPTIKPAFAYLFRRWLPSSSSNATASTSKHPDGKLYTNSRAGGYNHKSIKLATMNRAGNKRGAGGDEGSSTYQLAESVDGDGDFDSHAMDRHHRVTTKVTRGGEPGDQHRGSLDESDDADAAGITVQTETVVEVSDSRRAGARANAVPV